MKTLTWQQRVLALSTIVLFLSYGTPLSFSEVAHLIESPTGSFQAVIAPEELILIQDDETVADSTNQDNPLSASDNETLSDPEKSDVEDAIAALEFDISAGRPTSPSELIKIGAPLPDPIKGGGGFVGPVTFNPRGPRDDDRSGGSGFHVVAPAPPLGGGDFDFAPIFGIGEAQASPGPVAPIIIDVTTAANSTRGTTEIFKAPTYHNVPALERKAHDVKDQSFLNKIKKEAYRLISSLISLKKNFQNDEVDQYLKQLNVYNVDLSILLQEPALTQEMIELDGQTYMVTDLVLVGEALAQVHMLLHPPKHMHPYMSLLLYERVLTPEILNAYYTQIAKIKKLYSQAKAGSGKIRYRGKVNDAFLPLPDDMGGAFELFIPVADALNQGLKS